MRSALAGVDLVYLKESFRGGSLCCIYKSDILRPLMNVYQ